MNCKTCSKCKIEKPLSDFSKAKTGKNELRGDCKECCALYREQNKDQIKEQRSHYYEQNKDKMKERHSLYYEQNKDKMKEQKALYYQQNKDKVKEQKTLYYQQKISEQHACVYQILNKQNGKIYIGQTKRGEIRWKNHLYNLRGQRHPNKKLQQDFDLFGEETFEWEMLFEVPEDEKILLLEEALMITDMIKNGFELYNEAITIEQLALINENETMETK